MKILSQRDPKWDAVHLGTSKRDIAHYGCTTCGISMLSDYFGDYTSPDVLAKNPNHYTPAGLVLWNNFIFPHFKFEWRGYTEAVGRIVEAMKNPIRAVLLQVDYGKHWVVGIRPAGVFDIGHKGDYLVADPWTGKKVWAKAVWHNVTGAAYFVKK